MSSASPTVAPVEVDRPSDEDVKEPARLWIVIVWNDPINLMSYVTYVFQKLFGYPREKATKLMLDVHHKGKAIVSSVGLACTASLTKGSDRGSTMRSGSADSGMTSPLARITARSSAFSSSRTLPGHE